MGEYEKSVLDCTQNIVEGKYSYTVAAARLRQATLEQIGGQRRNFPLHGFGDIEKIMAAQHEKYFIKHPPASLGIKIDNEKVSSPVEALNFRSDVTISRINSNGVKEYLSPESEEFKEAIKKAIKDEREKFYGILKKGLITKPPGEILERI